MGRQGMVALTAGEEFLLVDARYAEEKAFLIDIKIFPGNSGSPVISLNALSGKVNLVGLVISTRPFDYAVAEPVSRIKEVVDLARSSNLDFQPWHLVANYLATIRRDVETRNLEARKQYLTRQLELYTEATRAAAKLATSNQDSREFAAAKQRFWELYWGELSMVENAEVETAMKWMGNCLDGECGGCFNLERCSLGLAHACRRSLADSWGVPDWRY